MAAKEGEERLLTFFADVHYYFSEPAPRPTAHRFDKGSYLYLYGNKSGNGARLEIANNVRQPEQDAFTGSMESTTIRQSHKHPTLCTITVDGYHPQHDQPAALTSQPEYYWRLPNTDPRNEGKYLFRLHTLDIYFWKPDDAHSFVAAARHRLQSDQVNVLDAPPTPAAHEQVVSPVVQQLENVAIQDPAYRNGQTRSSKPISPVPMTSPKSNVPRDTAAQGTSEAHNTAAFQPLAYNPAAPAAPEPIKHREKTPPPVDAEEGTGLAGAAFRDHAQTMSPPNPLSQPSYNQVSSPQAYVNPQPPQSHTPGYASPPPQPGHGISASSAQGPQTSSVSSVPPLPPPSGRGSVGSYASPPSFAPPPNNPQSGVSGHSEQAVPSFSAPPQERAPFYRKDTNPPESPATEILGNSYVAGVRQPLQHLQPQYANYTPSPPTQDKPGPVGGYADYQYAQPQPQHHHHHPHQGNQYDIHSQVYRPTPEEASKHKPSKPSTAGSASPSGRLEQGAGRVDKKVNSFFKKLEKKVG